MKKKSEDKVSIIIPIFNAEKYLSEAIESCINQTFPNIEILGIIHDCTDNSLGILKKYSDQITIIEKHGINAAQAINIGIKKMTGNWFKLMSADDVFYPNCIECLLPEAKKHVNKKIIICSNWKGINSKGQYTVRSMEPNRSKLSHFEKNVILLNAHYGNILTSLIHKKIFENYGFFDESNDIPADAELWLRLCLQYGYSIHVIPNILLKYRFHEEQESKRLTKNHPEGLKKLRKILTNKVLSRLDPNLKKEYEIALEQYQKKSKLGKKYDARLTTNYSFSGRAKGFTYGFLNKLSPIYAKKVSRLYKKISSK